MGEVKKLHLKTQRNNANFISLNLTITLIKIPYFCV